MSYELIETIEVGAGGAASIEFTGIADDGTDLVVLFSGRSSDTSRAINLYFNGTNQVTGRTLDGTGSSVSSRSSATDIGQLPPSSATASTFGSIRYYIANYASSSAKSISVDSVTENNDTAAFQHLVSGTSSLTAAINSVKLTAPTSFVEGSTASLYKVSNADASGATPEVIVPKASGGTIELSGGYFYHTFTSSSTFTPSEDLTCDYIVVSGGGAGGNGGTDTYTTAGGGGGAGGVYAETGASVSSGVGYTIIVGAGGSQASGSGSSAIVSGTIAGGGRGGGGGGSALDGGSGGGAGQRNDIGGIGSAGSNGGNGGSSDPSGAGGGGYSQVGEDGSRANQGGKGGDGGDGVQLSALISGFSTNYVAGGGGGGLLLFQSSGGPFEGGDGGLGGGGYAFDFLNGFTGVQTAGTTNTGGGGGGGYNQQASGPITTNGSNGGSGIVIVRYAA